MAKDGVADPLDIIAQVSNELNSFSDSSTDTFATVGDAVQLFEPGLYILGATPACGKTTFAWQLLKQISKLGIKCIFCSYEMSKYELETKTLARNLFLVNSQTTLTAADILRGGWTNDLESVIDEALHNKNFIVRKFSTENVDKLLSILRPIVQNGDKSPVVTLTTCNALFNATANLIYTHSLSILQMLYGLCNLTLLITLPAKLKPILSAKKLTSPKSNSPEKFNLNV